MTNNELDRRLELVFEGLEDPMSANLAADEIGEEFDRLNKEIYQLIRME